jgi:hypothetical protein
LASLPPGGLEAPADLINLADQVNVQAVEVIAGSVTHPDSVLGLRSVGYWPPEPAWNGQSTKTHFEEDVRFARDCDIALAICEVDPKCWTTRDVKLIEGHWFIPRRIMTGTRKRYSAAFKARVALEAAKQTRTLAELSKTFQVHPVQISQ